LTTLIQPSSGFRPRSTSGDVPQTGPPSGATWPCAPGTLRNPDPQDRVTIDPTSNSTRPRPEFLRIPLRTGRADVLLRAVKNCPCIEIDAKATLI
jgi:hypothetical protein